jgi:hypothetical protein
MSGVDLWAFKHIYPARCETIGMRIAAAPFRERPSWKAIALDATQNSAVVSIIEAGAQLYSICILHEP